MTNCILIAKSVWAAAQLKFPELAALEPHNAPDDSIFYCYQGLIIFVD